MFFCCSKSNIILSLKKHILIIVMLSLAGVEPNHLKQANKMLIDFDYLVSQLYVQHCTFVEIGEGICSLFVELNLDSSSSCKQPTGRQMFFGNCLCSEFRGWQLCSHQLALQRPEDCVFEEGVDCPSSSARVHRRLCDVTGMSQWNSQCNCSVPLAGLQQEPLCGFRSCYASPMPASICTPLAVCGTARCDVSLHGSLYAIKCDRRCKDHQSFCDQRGPATGVQRVVTSEWSQWKSLCGEDTTSIQQSEAECLDTEGKPAFDCIGPGLLCCKPEEVDCICEVKQEDGHLKVFRFTVTLLNSKESEHLSVRARSVGLKGQAKVFNRLINMASTEEKSDSLFSNFKQNGKKSTNNIQLEQFKLQENQINVHNSNLDVNIPQSSQNNNEGVLLKENENSVPSDLPEKENKKHDKLTKLHNNSLQQVGVPKNVSLNTEKEDNVSTNESTKNNADSLGTDVENSFSKPETQEDISNYHFTINPNLEISKKTTRSEHKVKEKNEKRTSLSDESFQEKTYDSKENNDNEENIDIKLNDYNKGKQVEDENDDEQPLKDNTDNKNLNSKLNVEMENEIANEIDSKILLEENKYPKENDKYSSTNSDISMEPKFFQNEADYNNKNQDSDKNNQKPSNLNPHLSSSTSFTLKSLKTQQINHNTSQMTETNHFKTTTTEVDSNKTYTRTSVTYDYLSESIAYSTSKVDEGKYSTENASDETKMTTIVSNSLTTKAIHRKGKYGNIEDEDCSSISESNTTLTNQSNGQSDKSLNANTKSKVKSEEYASAKDTSTTSTNPSNTQTRNNSLPSSTFHSSTHEIELLSTISTINGNITVKHIPFLDEGNISTIPMENSTTACTTIVSEHQPKTSVSKLYSKELSTTEITNVTNPISVITQKPTMNTTITKKLSSEIKSTQTPPDKLKGKLTKSKENIFMDQKDALQTLPNVNPSFTYEEDGSKSQNHLYDEPEPVLKDLDKDVVDDNMADVLNNVIGMKHFRDKLAWTEKNSQGERLTPKENRAVSENSKTKVESSKSTVDSQVKGHLDVHEHRFKNKKLKKKMNV